ncbi:MAG: hypothetical protein OHK0032_02420 [Thermodesulfovibrionales bacterium]
MSKLRYLIRNINLLNIMLTAVIVLLAGYTILPYKMKLRYTLPAAKDAAEVKEEKRVDVKQSPPPLEYTVIAEQNIFHPERKIPVGKKDEKPEIKPEFVLYGTLITDNASLAFLEDTKSPYTSMGRGKRQRALRLGASLSGFTLKEIYHDRVVMVKGEERIEVRVLDSKKARASETAAPKAAAAAPVPPQPIVRQPAHTAITPSAPTNTARTRIEQQTPPPLPQKGTVLGVGGGR